MKISKLLLVSILAAPLLALADEPPKQKEAQDQDFAKLGQSELKEGKQDAALKSFVAGWDKTKDAGCLDGIVTIYMIRKDMEGIKRYIEPILLNSKDSRVFLQVALAYAMQAEDEKLFRRCLANVKPEWLKEHPALQEGISRGAIKFFAKSEEEKE